VDSLWLYVNPQSRWPVRLQLLGLWFLVRVLRKRLS
jgi:hypothetical protein